MTKNHKHFFFIILYFLILTQKTFSQEAVFEKKVTTENNKKLDKKVLDRLYSYFRDSNKSNENKNFDISFIGGPSYSIDTKLGIGVIASGLYRIDKDNLALPPSNVSIYTNLSTTGFFAIGIEGNNIFKNDDYRIIYDMSFSLMPSKYWGIGYSFGSQNDYFSKYKEYKLSLKVDGLRKVTQNTYAGLTVSTHNIQGKDFENWNCILDENPNNTAIGGGFILSYDSRDFIPNAHKGLYIKIEQNYFFSPSQNRSNYSQFNFTTRHYRKIWQGGILAFDFNTIINNGNVPWSMLALVGGSTQMRGYFKGQYRDKKFINSQVELRQKIYNRSGIVVWGGAGNVFPNFKSYKWNETLPTFGLGYRWEFKNRINIRLDYGIGKNQSGFYFNINESF